MITEVRGCLFRSDAQALIAHGRFLEAKFGQTAGPDLTIGPP